MRKKIRSNLSRTQIIGLAIMSSHQHWRYKCNQSLSLSRKPIIHCPFLGEWMFMVLRKYMPLICMIFHLIVIHFTYAQCTLYRWNGREKIAFKSHQPPANSEWKNFSSIPRFYHLNSTTVWRQRNYKFKNINDRNRFFYNILIDWVRFSTEIQFE